MHTIPAGGSSDADLAVRIPDTALPGDYQGIIQSIDDQFAALPVRIPITGP